MDYSGYDKLNARLEAAAFFQDEGEFTSKVKLLVGASSERVDELHLLVQDLTAGSGKLLAQGERFLPVA